MREEWRRREGSFLKLLPANVVVIEAFGMRNGAEEEGGGGGRKCSSRGWVRCPPSPWFAFVTGKYVVDSSSAQLLAVYQYPEMSLLFLPFRGREEWSIHM